jgi:hypothetical protein
MSERRATKLDKALENQTQINETVVVVSGLPRSGTSMMMKMLEAGGLPPLTDLIRTSDDDNPKGYYEFERVKKLPKGDTAWLEEARGKGVKVISALLQHLPPGYSYRVIFMQRKMEEILASQERMLVRSGQKTDKVDNQTLASMYRKHLAEVKDWLAGQPYVSVLFMDYNQLLADPQLNVQNLNRFLDHTLDEGRMMLEIDPQLYRQRR